MSQKKNSHYSITVNIIMARHISWNMIRKIKLTYPLVLHFSITSSGKLNFQIAGFEIHLVYSSVDVRVEFLQSVLEAINY